MPEKKAHDRVRSVLLPVVVVERTTSDVRPFDRSRDNSLMARGKPSPVKIIVDLQLGKLRAACTFPYAIRGVCLAVIDQGIALLRSGYQRDSALWIHRLALRCQEVEPAAERPAYAQRPRPKPGDETAEALLASVPGVSTISARALLDRFGSVAAVVAADQAEWLTVPGIGLERARALEETFHLRRATQTSA